MAIPYLPDELWDTILHNVVDRSSVLVLRRVCTEFRNHLRCTYDAFSLIKCVRKFYCPWRRNEMEREGLIRFTTKFLKVTTTNATSVDRALHLSSDEFLVNYTREDCHRVMLTERSVIFHLLLPRVGQATAPLSTGRPTEEAF